MSRLLRRIVWHILRLRQFLELIYKNCVAAAATDNDASIIRKRFHVSQNETTPNDSVDAASVRVIPYEVCFPGA